MCVSNLTAVVLVLVMLLCQPQFYFNIAASRILLHPLIVFPSRVERVPHNILEFLITETHRFRVVEEHTGALVCMISNISWSSGTSSASEQEGPQGQRWLCIYECVLPAHARPRQKGAGESGSKLLRPKNSRVSEKNYVLDSVRNVVATIVIFPLYGR